MSTGCPDLGEEIAAESSEPGKESGGGPSTTEKSSLSLPLKVARLSLVGAVVAALITGGATLLAAKINHGSNSTPPQATDSGDMPVPNCPTCITGGKTFTEQAGGGGSHPTFRNPLVFGGPGQSVQPGEKVEVVCRFFQPNAPPSVKHDGWWYLVASQPWNRHYYTVANSYLNGDPPEGPYITNVDNGVPECTTKS
ncbi:MAG: hypothetical protein JO281_09680 [Pseudonocardiales bacterium]|nr:hypothetical protein [Pseudonocardiales bacterium]MBV9161802.1 hypothetical protein [Pseudonocardiales bacterium]